ncbi:MAG: DHH family phosphoesterase [Candidatus Nanoarchaeia archaeon]|nr:DHH family phosphoesterase [Candidatus Nanoarchaeia archaeon]MDD5358479.1 DHH family phosphoesterase [Candidatus Nanoarchaeia archaeon]MDD5588993.1 DHH family phosphoesterase [Candidatus Nanoarchaeia archaeon]
MEKKLESEIENVANRFIESISDKNILVISHFDTDGITSATIFAKTLKRLDKKFSLRIVKRIEEETIQNLPKDRVIVFLDLASGSLNEIVKAELKDVFIIDHHEIIQEIPEGVNIINPHLNGKEELSSSSLVYLFCRQINPENKELAKLAILGMIGDSMEKSIDKLNNFIISDGEVKRKRGLLIYPSTRPLNRTLEYCSDPYIPEITGNTLGVIELLREVGINSVNGKYKSLIELDDDEMSKLVTAIMLKNPRVKNKEIIGDIFLIKFFNKLEDARELSAMINACSRLGESGTAVQFCMESMKAKKKVELMHTKYKQFIISGLKFVSESEKIMGNGFVIINAKGKIKDTIIGTIASILSNSSIYEEGTIITTMAYYDDKIKVSARSVGRTGRNIRELLASVIDKLGGEVGGHQFAAGCMIKQEKEEEFINHLKKSLEIELVKI